MPINDQYYHFFIVIIVGGEKSEIVLELDLGSNGEDPAIQFHVILIAQTSRLACSPDCKV
jgi:hypothetical protein